MSLTSPSIHPAIFENPAGISSRKISTLEFFSMLSICDDDSLIGFITILFIVASLRLFFKFIEL